MKIGCDLVKIERFNGLNEKFLDKYFTQNELEYAKSKKSENECLAGMFAVKESVLKALQIGMGNGLSICDVEISHGEFGQLYILKNDKLEKYLKGRNIEISCSHDGEYAVAYAIMF